MGDLLHYSLPEARIAQFPAGKDGDRASSKLLHVQLNHGVPQFHDRHFFELPTLLLPGDLLVLNNSRVCNWRYFIPLKSVANSEKQGEVLLLEKHPRPNPENDSSFELFQALAYPMKEIERLSTFRLGQNLIAEALGRTSCGTKLILKVTAESGTMLEDELEREGSTPIPPYIRAGRSDAADRELYQTIYSEPRGSVAAPTAGLHFTKKIFDELRKAGIETAFLTLHVGRGSFELIKQSANEHRMAGESYSIPVETTERIRVAKQERRRVIAVGTTTVRALESSANQTSEKLEDGTEYTEIFIKPGFEFQVVDSMITNFHQPRSTHLLLVSALLGEQAAVAAYEHALTSDYRFLSYGDSMLIDLAGKTD